MSKLERCKACRGSKYVLGMGSMRKDCVTCSKTGFVEIETDEDVDTVLSKSADMKKTIAKSVVKLDKRSKEYRDQQQK